MTDEELRMSIEAPTSPSEVLHQALVARDRLDFERVVSLCEASSVEAYYRRYCEYARPISVEETLSRHPQLRAVEPPITLEWVHENLGDPEAGLPEWVGVASHGELVALTPFRLAVRVLERRDIRFRLIQHCEKRGMPAPAFLRAPLFVRTAYEMLETTETTAGQVRCSYVSMWTSADGPVRSTPAWEDLSLGPSGGWGVYFRDAGLLQEHGEVAWIMPQEWADLISDE
jgi:hypothetical protein